MEKQIVFYSTSNICDKFEPDTNIYAFYKADIHLGMYI